MHPNCQPLLAPHVRVRVHDDRVQLEGDEASVDFHGAGIAQLAGVFTSLDGTLTIADLAARHGIGESQTQALLTPLHEDSLLLDIAAAERDYESVRSFQEAYRDECRFWSRHIFAQKFWKDLRAGRLPESVVLGWGVEFYHYVRHADVYMAAGVAYCADSWTARQAVAQHFVEEAGHGDIFLEGLVACGLSRSRVEQAVPLPATRALMNALLENAMSGALPYTAFFGLTQPDMNAPSAAQQKLFYGGLSDYYPAARELFAAFLNHGIIDTELGHDRTTCEKILDTRTVVDRSERRAVIHTVRRLAENFVLFFEQIADYYAEPSRHFPRRAPRLAELLDA